PGRRRVCVTPAETAPGRPEVPTGPCALPVLRELEVREIRHVGATRPWGQLAGTTAAQPRGQVGHLLTAAVLLSALALGPTFGLLLAGLHAVAAGLLALLVLLLLLLLGGTTTAAATARHPRHAGHTAHAAALLHLAHHLLRLEEAGDQTVD